MKSIWFYDEVFGTRLDWLRAFTHQYKKRIGLPFECLSDPRSAVDETIELLKEAGVKEILDRIVAMLVRMTRRQQEECGDFSQSA